MSAMRQIPLAIGPAPEASFETFVVGDNTLAVAQLRALTGPAYLWGASGTGKTHLLAASAHAAMARGAASGWFDAGAALPWEFDTAWSLVLLDDCQALDDARQRAAFALYIEAQAHGVPVVAAGALPPVDLPLREDLRTRLGWGTVFEILPLREAQARAVLRREADRRGIFLSDEVMGYLLTRFSRDLKHLMALLDRLDRFALAEHRAVTVPLLKRMFEEEGAEL
jgi:DnaA-homolog protein